MSRTTFAWVARIEKLEDIAGKDAIKYASLKGTQWQVITNVESTGLKEGDLACYVEYDSYLPADGGEKLRDKNAPSPFEFLRKNSFSPKRNAFKVRPMKMAGLVSYGLLIPIRDLDAYEYDEAMHEGFDLTELLGAKQADDFEFDSSCGERWMFPPYLSKTDEVRIEALSSSIYDELHDQEFLATLKVDGQSSTFALIGGEFYAASHNYTRYRAPIDQAVEELIPHDVYKWEDAATKLAAMVGLPKFMRDLYHGDFAIQGELCGPGIQGNRLGCHGLNLYVFSFVSLNGSSAKYLPYDEAKKIVETFSLRMVPEVWRGKFEFSNKAELKNLADVKYPNGAAGEGIVLRPVGEALLNEPLRGMGVMRSFKVINDSYALKRGGEE
jgi:RNA ligase (TIGR02306 family)